MDKKILIMVLSIEMAPFNTMIDGIKKTWGNFNNDNVDICYYYGNSDVPKMIDKNIYLPVRDTFGNILKKTLLAFDYVDKNFEFDYVYRCCTGSYIDIEKLIEYVKNKPKQGYYSGYLGEHAGVPYCSGSGFFLSRDLLKFLYCGHSGEQPVCDDVDIGKFMHNHCGIVAENAPRFDGPFDDENYDDSYFHYHFRTDLSALHFVHEKKRKNNEN